MGGTGFAGAADGPGLSVHTISATRRMRPFWAYNVWYSYALLVSR